jgi:hypothetical protein
MRKVVPMPVIGWLFEPNPGPPSAWYLALVAIFAIVFVGSLLAYVFRRSLFPGHSLHVRLASRFAIYGMILGAAGLFFLATRYAGIPVLQMRVWLVLCALAAVALAGYAAYFYRMRYPTLLVAHRTEEARLRYVKPHRPGGSGGGARRRAKKGRR